MTTQSPMTDGRTSTRISRWTVGAVGVGAMAWAAWLVLTGGAATDPVAVAIWLVGGLVVHDAVLAPLVLALGWVAARVLPPWLRAPVQLGALVGGVVALASVPLLLGKGRRPDNPSANPLDYSRNLLIVLTAIALVCAAWALLRWRRERRTRAQVRRSETNLRPPEAQVSSSS